MLRVDLIYIFLEAEGVVIKRRAYAMENSVEIS